MTDKKLHAIPDAAAVLSISPRVLERLIADGKVDTVKIGRRRLVPDEALDAYIARIKAAS